MSINTQVKQKINLSQISFGQHGQMSVILRLIKSYFLYKSFLSADEEQALIKVLCFNIKHFLALNEGQKFLAYEKNNYSYYEERSSKAVRCKKAFLDLFVYQTMLTKEYQTTLKKGCLECKDLIEEIIMESKECENIIKHQIIV